MGLAAPPGRGVPALLPLPPAPACRGTGADTACWRGGGIEEEDENGPGVDAEADNGGGGAGCWD